MPVSVPQAEPFFARLLEAEGYRLVRLRMNGTVLRTLQVMAERQDGTMDVEGCAQISGLLSDVLETDDPIGGDYVIEVSSPGIDRPLTRLEDFVRWTGFDAKIELTAPLEGKKRYKAVLNGVSGDDVLIAVGPKDLRIPFDTIAEAKLILTDKLIEASSPTPTPTPAPTPAPALARAPKDGATSRKADRKNTRQNARTPRATGD